MKRPGIRSRLVGLLDDLLPVPGDERAEESRHEGTADDETRSRRRRLLLRLREKAGRGGFR